METEANDLFINEENLNMSHNISKQGKLKVKSLFFFKLEFDIYSLKCSILMLFLFKRFVLTILVLIMQVLL